MTVSRIEKRKMTEIIPGIHWIKLPMINSDGSDLDFVNAYVIRGNSGYLLVDSGWNTDASFAALKKGMAEIGSDIKDISQILVTHVHPDHYGMAGRVKKLSGASLAMHHIDQGFIDSRYVNMEPLINQIDRLLLANGVPSKMIASLSQATVGLEQYVVVTYPDITLHDSETVTTGLFTFKVIWTPGHSSGHICLYEPEKKILLSGDHVLPSITPNVSVNPQAIENPLGRYIDSLNELKRLDVEIVLPGHEKPFTGFKKRIDKILQHHEQRNGEILTALGNKPRTSFQIAQEVSWGLKGSWQSLPDFHKRMAILETLAHLEMMASRGQVDRLPGEDIMLFRQASPRR
jgi:glyoxylase-like metal-dependent hydrolase (beta-lactamase superfamily II)